MQPATARLTRAQRDAYEAVRRACHAPLDSIQLREEVAFRIADVLPSDFSAMSTSDPESGVLAHGMTWHYPDDLLRDFYHRIYPHEAAMRFFDMARTGDLASICPGPIEAECLRAARVGSKLNVALAESGKLRGGWCLGRREGGTPFGDEEQQLARLVALLLGAGLRRAALLEAAQAADEPDGEPSSAAPGVAVYDAAGRLLLRDARAARYLDDLADLGSSLALPSAVAGAVTQLRWRLRAPQLLEDSQADAGVRLCGRSRRWYTVHASEAEATDACNAGQVVVVLTPLGGGERASLLAQMYGLTPREREVAVRSARGESGKQIAAALGLSAHTVQAYIDSACTKIGVRGRRELVARLFVDSMAMRAAS